MTEGLLDGEIRDRAAAVLDACRHAGLMLVTAESCTGGLIAAALTEIPGSSDVLDRSFVTYSYAAKSQMLGVPAGLIAAKGAVSAEVARAMAEGALAHAEAGLAIAVTGVAGPGSDSQAKPAGLVHLASALRGHATVHEVQRFGDIGRARVRRATVLSAFAHLLGRLSACS